MMTRSVVAALLVLVILAVSVRDSNPAPASADKYTTRFDSIDVDGILKSDRLLRNYANCVLDKGPCTREGQELRKLIPDALQTECTKCSEIQKKQAGKVMAFVQLKHPDIWNAILDKYDPEKTFRKKYGYDEDDDEDEE
uniref:Chemosensory protein 19 n=1 Tax=Agrilus planipennis TaxID=224129 RepID=A0A890ULR8_AGRPL|nr:chemosensory protein 19 [Agrilus planipennis]